jgi:hypothetical protein
MALGLGREAVWFIIRLAVGTTCRVGPVSPNCREVTPRPAHPAG